MAKPVVDGIAQELDDDIPIVKIDVRSQVGGRIAGSMGVRSIPTLVVWSDKPLLTQVGRINKQAVLDAVQKP